MNQQLAWMARNQVAAILLLLFFAVGGLILAFSIKQEVFPEIAPGQVLITVKHPGASPDEVEEGIILKIEDNLSNVSGIEEILATATEGMAVVRAVIDRGVDDKRVLLDIKNEIDQITFPIDAERPIVSQALIRNEVISVVVYGQAAERALRQRAELVRDDLLALDGITQVELVGVRDYEISIEISEEMLRRHQLTLEGVAMAVRQASQNIPGGVIKTSAGAILLRTKERRYLGWEYEDIVIKASAGGALLRLGDIATIHDGFAEIDLLSRFNGLPAVMVKVFRVGEQRPLTIADIVRRYVEDRQSESPLIGLALWDDNSEALLSRFELLLKNAIFGLLLVFVILGLFLGLKLSLWVMLALPVSFLGAIIFMLWLGVSINMISLFAFIMALGIVVDNSIVVGESIYEQRSRDKSRLKAAVEGVQEIAVPVVFSVLTTVAAFLPLLYTSGIMGQFIRNIPLVVISILAVSLAVSLFSLPALLGRGKDDWAKAASSSRSPANWFKGLSKLVNRWLQWLIDGPYRRTLEFCLSYRGLTLALALVALMLTTGLVGGGMIQFRFMPEVDGDMITVELEMPQGTLVEDTAKIEAFIVKQAKAAVAEFDAQGENNETILRNLYSVIGSAVVVGDLGRGRAGDGAHLANIIMILTPSEVRGPPTTAEVSRRWRELVGEIPGVHSLTFTTNLIRFGANIDVQLAHRDSATLLIARDRLKKDLALYPGVSDIADNFTEGKRELQLRLRPEARSLGITEEELGRQVRGAFFGAEALRLQRGRDEVRVLVRYPEEQRRSVWNLERMMIRTPEGGEVPLFKAAYLEEDRGFATINRSDRKRVINVTARVDANLANAEAIIQSLRQDSLARLVADFPGLTYNLEGEEKERRESMDSMKQGFVMAMLAIYVLLAIPLRSFGQPLIVMAAIPFGIVGAMLGHGLLGHNLSILSIFGIVALSGVVVNNSMLLIYQINRNLAQGHTGKEAVIAAGCRRFRPIILTSLTTFLGLFPLILETSVQAQFLIPMAISLGCGVLFATFITLVLVPTLCGVNWTGGKGEGGERLSGMR